MSRGTSLAVVLLVLLAGCSGLTASQSPPVSVTPAAVPAEGTATPSPAAPASERHAPQISNYSAMAEAHSSLLTDESYTVIATQTVHYPGTGRRGERRLSGRFAGDGRFLAEVNRTGPVFGAAAPTETRYFSDGRRVLRTDGPNRSNGTVIRTNSGDPTAVLPLGPRFASELRQVFATSRVENLTRLPRDGRPYQQVLVEVRGPVDPTRPPPLVSTTVIRNLTADLVVDERGFVQRFDVRYEATFVGQPVRVTLSVSYGAVGDTAVERPAWAESTLRDRAGRNATSTAVNATP